MMVRDQLDGEQQHYLQRVFENAQRIKAIVDDMVALRYLDSEQAEPSFEACDLEAVIGETCEQVRMAAREKGQELLLDLPTPTRCSLDREKFQLVLAHLLSNAIKFTDQGGRVEVRVRVEMRAEAQIIVEVQDTGVGIPLKDQGRIFDRFYQVADSLTRAHGGTGLGLAVAKELVTVMGGTLDVSSSVGRGSTFRLALPYHPA
jgi:signal transduction histidine kinase